MVYCAGCGKEVKTFERRETVDKLTYHKAHVPEPPEPLSYSRPAWVYRRDLKPESRARADEILAREADARLSMTNSPPHLIVENRPTELFGFKGAKYEDVVKPNG